MRIYIDTVNVDHIDPEEVAFALQDRRFFVEQVIVDDRIDQRTWDYDWHAN